VSDAPAAPRRGFIARWAWRAAKSAVGLAIVGFAGVGPMQRLLELSSVDAVVNARLVSLRAPIDGRLEVAPLPPTIGAATQAGSMLLHITDRRADRSRLDDLRRLLDQIEGDRAALNERLTRLRELHRQIIDQARAFQEGRVRELEQRALDLRAQVAAADAAQSEAASALARIKQLVAAKVQSSAALERAQRDAVITAETARSLNHRLVAIEIELEAARRGEYVGDNYNDRPSSRQQADELSIRIVEGEAELSARDRRLDRLRRELDAEQARYADLSDVTVSSPIDGRVWEVLVSPGEEVRRGQDLLRLLDCSGAIVTTTVRESVFNELRIGDKAQFRPSGESAAYDGEVVRMSGIAAPPDNFAITAAGPSAAPYRIAVSVPELSPAQCMVGRTGRVVFRRAADARGEAPTGRDGLWSFLTGR
jgi:multidrug resistance efflux pump